MKLKEIVKEIEKTGKIYRNSKDKEERKAYNQYIDLLITEADQPQQYNLFDYWDRLIK